MTTIMYYHQGKGEHDYVYEPLKVLNTGKPAIAPKPRCVVLPSLKDVVLGTVIRKGRLFQVTKSTWKRGKSTTIVVAKQLKSINGKRKAVYN
jgi:hypothetical protein